MWFLALLACAHKVPPPATTPVRASVVELPAYTYALADAARPLAREVVEDLLVLDRGDPAVTWDDQGRVLVTTWSRSSYYDPLVYVDGYTFPLYGETWFTAGDEVLAACRGLKGDALALRVEQLLGLPPGGERDVFLRVWVAPEALFRPCAVADPTTVSCTLSGPLLTVDSRGIHCLPDADDHDAWLCNTWAARQGPADPLARFPFTALGYTYDWGKLVDHVGATEFVAPRDTPVALHSVVPNDLFCEGL